MVTIQSQNFGVEIEMTGVSRGTAASVIANYFGVGGIHFAGGTYQTYEAKDSKGRVSSWYRPGHSGISARYLSMLPTAKQSCSAKSCGYRSHRRRDFPLASELVPASWSLRPKCRRTPGRDTTRP